MPSDSPASRPLDGSRQALLQLLAELCALAGQDAAAPPVLELQLGAVVTRATVGAGPGGDCLHISVRLPRSPPSAYAAQARHSIGGDGFDCMWHADEGCHIVVRRMALAAFRDERSVMDAMLDTADLAQAWQAGMLLDQPAAC
ncbi:hypothetical protein [Massilia sp. YIM B04103]|uniref:hypothetical protein n=1 Tax=Massilia sp. YIM B04103 TaxID=2963106 RepID=UPI00210E006D|nr:hypothetical protein [Massilia sp. YIM B04103]